MVIMTGSATSETSPAGSPASTNTKQLKPKKRPSVTKPLPDVSNLKVKSILKKPQKSSPMSKTAASSSSSSSSINAKAVTFHNKKKTKRIPGITSMTDDMLDAIWWAAEDYDDILRSFEYTVFMMEAGEDRVVDDDQEHCTRGLELRTEAGKWARFENKRDCYNAVLDEQDRQWNAGEEDNQEKIANCCREVTVRTQRSACRKGMQDAKGIADYVADTRKEIEQYLSKTQQKQPQPPPPEQRGRISYPKFNSSKNMNMNNDNSSTSNMSASSKSNNTPSTTKQLPPRTKSNSKSASSTNTNTGNNALKPRVLSRTPSQEKRDRTPPRKPERVLSGKQQQQGRLDSKEQVQDAPSKPRRTVTPRNSGRESVNSSSASDSPSSSSSGNNNNNNKANTNLTNNNSSGSIRQSLQRVPARQTFTNNSSGNLSVASEPPKQRSRSVPKRTSSSSSSAKGGGSGSGSSSKSVSSAPKKTLTVSDPIPKPPKSSPGRSPGKSPGSTGRKVINSLLNSNTKKPQRTASNSSVESNESNNNSNDSKGRLNLSVLAKFGG